MNCLDYLEVVKRLPKDEMAAATLLVAPMSIIVLTDT